MRALRGWMMVVAGLAGLACAVPVAAPLQSESLGNPSPTGPAELDIVTVDLSRTRAATAESLDGRVRILVPALAVESTATLVLARLRDDLVPQPRLGPGYVVHLRDGVLQAPARVEWSPGGDVAVPAIELRLATLGPQGNVVAMGGAQVGPGVVAAQLTGAATLLLVNRQQMPAGFAPDVSPVSAGDALLWQGDLAGARSAYQAARLAGPNPQAALGRAVSDLGLLLKQQPLSDVLLRCGLPQDALFNAVLGPAGVLAQAAQDRAGSLAFNLQDATGSTSLQADETYARRSSKMTWLVARGQGFELRMWLPDTPVALGQPLSREQFPGQVELWSRGDRFHWEPGSAGTVTVFQRGVTEGSRVAVEWSGLSLHGAPGDLLVPAGAWSDVVTAAPDLLRALGVVAKDGPPVVPLLSALLKGCSEDVTLPWALAAAPALALRLQPIAADLAEAGAAPGETALLELPSGLTRLPRSLPLLPRDARLGAALLGAVRAALVVAGAYQVAGLDEAGTPQGVSKWIQDDGVLHKLDGDGAVVAVTASTLNHPRLAQEFNQWLLAPRNAGAGQLQQDLAPAREILEAALGDFRNAMGDSRNAPGLVRWDVFAQGGWSSTLKDLAESALASLPSGSSAVPWGEGSAVALNMSSLFDTPPTHDALLQANGGLPLAVAFGGAPMGRTPASQDAALFLVDNGAGELLWSSVLQLPPPATRAATCGPTLACEPGFACVPVPVGVCAVGASPCAGDDGCPTGDVCVQDARCVRQLPPLLDWDGFRALLDGPFATGLQPWAWHALQAITGQDPARGNILRY